MLIRLHSLDALCDALVLADHHNLLMHFVRQTFAGSSRLHPVEALVDADVLADSLALLVEALQMHCACRLDALVEALCDADISGLTHLLKTLRCACAGLIRLHC